MKKALLILSVTALVSAFAASSFAGTQIENCDQAGPQNYCVGIFDASTDPDLSRHIHLSGSGQELRFVPNNYSAFESQDVGDFGNLVYEDKHGNTVTVRASDQLAKDLAPDRHQIIKLYDNSKGCHTSSQPITVPGDPDLILCYSPA